MRVNTRIVSGSLAVILVTFPAATMPQAQQAGRPTFRGGITLVPLDVRVLDAAGRPVTDLKQEDFSIREDGQAQQIRHFSTHTFMPDPEAVRATPGMRTAQGPEIAPPSRRVFLIVLGRGRHQAVSKYVDALSNFVGRILPQDHVAVLAWNRATDFTTDHEKVKEVIARYRDANDVIEMELRQWFSGLQAVYGAKDIPPHIQTRIDAVFAAAEGLRPRPLAPAPIADSRRIDQDIEQTGFDLLRNRQIEEARSAGVATMRDLRAEVAASATDMTFDEYFARMTETLQDTGNLYAGIGYLRFLDGEKHLVFMTENGVSLPSQDDNASLARVAADARVALDFIYTHGVVGAPPPRVGPDGRVVMYPVATPDQRFAQTFAVQDLRLMADRTGGQLMAFRSGEDAFRRFEAGMGFQYLLGYTPSNVILDGKFRKISVRVNRRGVRVLVREGYVAAETPVALDRRTMITFNRIRAAAEHMSVVDHIKVTLGEPVGSATEVSVDITVDVSRLKFAPQNERHVAALDVAIFCGDERQRPVGERQRRVDLRLTGERYARALLEGLTFRMAVPVRDRARILKVIVYDYGADLVGTAVAKVTR